ncbi:hypothetical protein ACFE04_017522 [Oxalis oulophora]
MPADRATSQKLPPPPGKLELQIKVENDKFFSKLMSKESSFANSSTRIYYGGSSTSVNIPFDWETTPGIPKDTLYINDTPLPPLTPPPSYSYSNPKKSIQNNISCTTTTTTTTTTTNNNSTKPNLLSNFFPKRRSNHVTPSFTSSSSSFSSTLSSSSSSSWSPKDHFRRRHHSASYSRSPINSFNLDANLECNNMDEDHSGDDDEDKFRRSVKKCYPWKNMKNKLLSIVGGSHGSGGTSRGTS